MPKKVAAILFFFAWLLCGCGVETMLDSPASGAITLVALIVVIACANVLTRNDEIITCLKTQRKPNLSQKSWR